MLVLSRKVGDSILIGRDIEVTVLENRNGEVRLGIKAPREILVLRKEIQEAVLNENKSAASMKDSDLGKLLGPLVDKLKDR